MIHLFIYKYYTQTVWLLKTQTSNHVNAAASLLVSYKLPSWRSVWRLPEENNIKINICWRDDIEHNNSLTDLCLWGQGSLYLWGPWRWVGGCMWRDRPEWDPLWTTHHSAPHWATHPGHNTETHPTERERKEDCSLILWICNFVMSFLFL